jgi:Flp pilus assembly protein TadG
MPGPRHGASQRGATIVVVAIVLTMLLGFLGLVMNVGHSRMVRGQLQNSMDAAALAAARELNGMTTGLTAARSMANSFASQYSTDRDTTVAIDTAADVQFGHWDATARTFTQLAGTSVTQLQLMNAVRVSYGRETARGNALPVWLSSFLGGRTNMDVLAHAIAVGGGPIDEDCPLPIVLPSCALLPGDSYQCDEALSFTTNAKAASATVDTVGLTAFLSNGTGNSAIQSVLDAVIGGACVAAQAGDVIQVQNGNDVNKSMYDKLVQIIQANPTRLLPVVTMDGCPGNPQFNQPQTIITFATVTFDLSSLTWTPGADKGITLNGTLTCSTDNHLPGGGFFGTYPLPGLVQ